MTLCRSLHLARLRPLYVTFPLAPSLPLEQAYELVLDALHGKPVDLLPLSYGWIFGDLSRNVGTEQRFDWPAFWTGTFINLAIISRHDECGFKNSALFPRRSAYAFLTLLCCKEVEVHLITSRFKGVRKFIRVSPFCFNGLIN